MLFSPTVYPPSIRVTIELMPALATRIANHWMQAWPIQARELLASDEYLVALVQATLWMQDAIEVDVATDRSEDDLFSMLGPPPQPERR